MKCPLGSFNLTFNNGIYQGENTSFLGMAHKLSHIFFTNSTPLSIKQKFADFATHGPQVTTNKLSEQIHSLSGDGTTPFGCSLFYPSSQILASQQRKSLHFRQWRELHQ